MVRNKAESVSKYPGRVHFQNSLTKEFIAPDQSGRQGGFWKRMDPSGVRKGIWCKDLLRKISD